MVEIENLGNSLISQYFAKLKLRKSERKTHFPNVSIQTDTKNIVFCKKSEFDIFTPKRVKSHASKPLYQKIAIFSDGF